MPRSVLLNSLAFLLLLSAAAVGYTVLQVREEEQVRAREERERRESMSLMKEVRRSRRKTSFVGIRKVTMLLEQSRYTTTTEVRRQNGRRNVRFISSEVDGKKKRGRRTPYFGGVPSLFGPGKRVLEQFQNVDLLFENYEVRVAGVQEVAGRLGRVIEIRSRHKGRSSYRIVADRENHFPLLFVVWGHEGTKVFEKRFESIDFHPEEVRIVQKRKKRRAGSILSWVKIEHLPMAKNDLSKAAGFPVWAPQWIPAGFQLANATMVRIKTNPPRMFAQFKMDIHVLHWTYTDGMAVFSIIEFPSDNLIWKRVKGCLPEVSNPKGVVTRKLKLGVGAALILDLKKTVVVLAGNIWSKDLEESGRTLVKK